MQNVRTLEFGIDRRRLEGVVTNDAFPDELLAPLQSLASEIVDRVTNDTVSIYVGSDDADSDVRNQFAFALVRSVMAHVPDVLMIDCDFLEVGLSGAVPHSDGLGFLDLLLYGSSLGAITQQAVGGVKIIGAGSFPVSKKSPFVMDAFLAAQRYLLNQSKCLIYAGPVTDDDENVHPIIEHVDLPVLVQTGKRVRSDILDPLEDKVSSATSDPVWSVRIVSPAEGSEQERPEEHPSSPQEPSTPIESAGGTEREEDSAKPDEPQPVIVMPHVGSETEPPPRPPIEMPYDGTETASPASDDESVPSVDEIGEIPASDVDAERVAGAEETPGAGAGVASAPEGNVEAPGDVEKLGDEEIQRNRAEEEPPAGDPRVDGEIRVRRRIAVRSSSSAFPWVVAAIVAVGLVAFVVWWLVETRSVLEPQTGQQAPSPARMQQPEEVVQTEAADEITPVDTDEAVRGGQPSTTDSGVAAQEQTPPPVTSTIPSTPAATDRTREMGIAEFRSTAPGAENISATNTLEAFSGMLFVHVFSFETMEAAVVDAEYLAGRGYNIVIALVDLGSRGVWYRVYVGPLADAREANRTKIRLDENPRVKSTRVEKVPD
ncbi:MAG: SPOR domain-containing protein [bacterium]|nr:SPOR domain-containing protein [bacterium]